MNTDEHGCRETWDKGPEHKNLSPMMWHCIILPKHGGVTNLEMSFNQTA